MNTDRKILQKTIKDAQKVIDKAKKDMGALEVTYSIGDRFKGSCVGKQILVCVKEEDYTHVVLVSLKDGTAYGSCLFEVKDGKKITCSEMKKIMHFNDLTRYWDCQKEVKT